MQQSQSIRFHCIVCRYFGEKYGVAGKCVMKASGAYTRDRVIYPRLSNTSIAQMHIQLGL